MLEVLIRRHYREFKLHDMRERTAAGRPLVTADYVVDERPTRLVTSIAQASELVASSDFVAAVDTELEGAPVDHAVVVDLYLSWPGAPDSDAEMSGALQQVLRTLPFAQ